MLTDEIRRSILRVIADREGPSRDHTADVKVAEATGLDVGDVRDYLDLLEEEGLVRLLKHEIDEVLYVAWLEARGRQYLKRQVSPAAPHARRISPMISDEVRREVLGHVLDELKAGGDFAEASTVASRMGIDEDHLLALLEVMGEEGLVRTQGDTGGVDIELTGRGRLLLMAEAREEPSKVKRHPRRIFITHGHHPVWREIQRYIEKRLRIETLELAEEAFKGRTIIQKLDEESSNCGYAVIVMTGDDRDVDGTPRARENVMHEIGFFQGRYGLDRVCLLHAEGVSIPTNIKGLGYVPFQPDNVKAAFADLQGEIDAAYPPGS